MKFLRDRQFGGQRRWAGRLPWGRGRYGMPWHCNACALWPLSIPMYALGVPSRSALPLVGAMLLLLLPVAAQQQALPNAAKHYRQAIAELRQQFGHDQEKLNRIDVGRGNLTPEWRAAVAKAADVLALVRRATQVPRCAFQPCPAGGLAEVGASAFEFVWLRRLTSAHGWQHLPNNPEVACQDAFVLLDFAHHLASDPSAKSFGLATECECEAASLMQAALDPGPGAPNHKLQRLCQKRLQQHSQRRLTMAALADNLMAECKLMLAQELANKDRLVDYRVIELLTQIFEPLRWENPPTAKQAKAMRRAFTINVMKHCAALRKDDIAGNEQREDAAVANLELLCPSMVRILESREKATAALEAASKHAK